MPIDAHDTCLDEPYVPAPTRYDNVEYRRAGSSGIQLPPISLGLWQNFGADRAGNSQRAIIRHAFDRGITHYDLANNYGPPYGAAESTLGRLLATDLRPYRDELFLATKAGYDMWPGPYGDGGSRKYLIRSLEQSLTRLNTDYVDVFYSHRPDPNTPLEETMSALTSIVASGKALYVGLSNYPAELASTAADLLDQAGVRMLLHQPRYSLFDRTHEADLLPLLVRRNIGCAVFSPLAQGLLTDKYLTGSVPADSRAANSRFLNSGALTTDYLERIQGLDRLARGVGESIAALAIAWVLRQPAVTTAIVGASRPAQLDEAIAATRLELDADTVDQLESFGAAVGARLG